MLLITNTILEPNTDEECSQCGPNTIHVNATTTCTCQCKPDYVGDHPHLGCRPTGCILNSDCPSDLACLSTQCTDPCPGVCGINALCSVTNHRPFCYCKPGFNGNPYDGCSTIANCKKHYFNQHQTTIA